MNQFHQYHFVESRIPTLDALTIFIPNGQESDKALADMNRQVGQSRWYPVPGGHEVRYPFEKQPYDKTRFQIEKEGWDHENCKNCNDTIPSMTLCWVAEEKPRILLCEKCHQELKNENNSKFFGIRWKFPKIRLNSFYSWDVFLNGVAFALIIIFAISFEITKYKSSHIDQAVAGTMLNKSILVGITYVTENDKFISQKEFFGTIARINKEEGIVIKLANSNEELKLPSQLDQIEEAEPGEYQLSSTGQVITNPDYLTTWISAHTRKGEVLHAR